MAFLFTERYCEARIGKVYFSKVLSRYTIANIEIFKVFYVLIEERISKRKYLKREKKLVENVYIYYRLPKLLYYLVPWEEEDIKIWRGMAHIGTST